MQVKDNILIVVATPVSHLENFNEAHGASLVFAGAVHCEPLAVYSKKIKVLGELRAGDKVTVPKDVTNEAQAL